MYISIRTILCWLCFDHIIDSITSSRVLCVYRLHCDSEYNNKNLFLYYLNVFVLVSVHLCCYNASISPLWINQISLFFLSHLYEGGRSFILKGVTGCPLTKCVRLDPPTLRVPSGPVSPISLTVSSRVSPRRTVAAAPWLGYFSFFSGFYTSQINSGMPSNKNTQGKKKHNSGLACLFFPGHQLLCVCVYVCC